MDAKTRNNIKAAYLNVGNVELEAGRYEQALDALRQALELDPHYPLAHYALGVIYQAQSQIEQEDGEVALLEQAATHLERAIAGEPKLVEAYHLLAAVFKDLGREEERVQWLEQAAEQAPASFQTWQNLGAAYRAQRRWPEAAAAYEKALDLAPDNTEILRALARVCYQSQDWERAARFFERAVANEGATAEDFNRLGSAYFFLKQSAEALRAFEKAVRLAPENAVYQGNLGLLLAELQRHEEAE